MDQNCNICGESHDSNECTIVRITNYVHDNEIPSRAKLSLPNFLQLQILTDGSYTVITKEHLAKGTKFGPLIARKVDEVNASFEFPMKVFAQSQQENGNDYYLDTTNENECNWLIFVSIAEFLEEQNLICYQEDADIYYVSIKDIEPRQMLKVWYSPYYGQKMKKNMLVSSTLLKNHEFDTQTTIQLKNIDLNGLVKKQQKIVEKKQWLCKFCNKIDSDIVTFAKHLIVHYRMQLKKMCEICKQTFNSKKNLTNHLKIVHYSDNPPPIDDQLANQSGLKSKIKDQSVGGPLLNDMFTDSTDLQQFNLNTTINNNQNLLDDDIENLLLNDEEVENFEHFNFNLIDEKQQENKLKTNNDRLNEYECEICLKKFKKVHLLLIHLKHHTGEYLCTKCLKIFCRKENLTTHLCNCVKFYKCDLCNDDNKKFTQKKYLKRHILIKHKLRFYCNLCKTNYYSKYELLKHNCCNVSNLFKEKFVCTICDKVFYRQIYLRRHLKTHLPKSKQQQQQQETNTTMNCTICEICGVLLESKNSLYLHMKKHKEPKYDCQICLKKFHRLDSLQIHERTHQSTAEFECNLCLKKFKTRSTLQEHINYHNGKLLKCKYCEIQFKHRSTLNKHIKNKHNKNDNNNTTILLQYFSCPICDKRIKLRSSLLRHLRKIHPNDYKNVDLLNIKPKVLSKDDDKIKAIDKKQEDVVIKNEDEDGDNEKEVCLSIPDLTEKDQEIMLDRNAYILENGTIIQPQLDSDKVIIYVLDQIFN